MLKIGYLEKSGYIKNKYSHLEGSAMSEKAFNNLLKHIDKLSHTNKERVFQWVKRYVEPSSTVDGRLINEMREVRFKEGFECPHYTSRTP